MINLTMNYTQLRQALIDTIMVGLTPFVTGSPGLGKSSLVKSIADEFNLELIDFRLTTAESTDLSGLPNFTKDGKAYYAPFNVFPLDTDPLPEGKDGFCLFLDEFNSATKPVIAAAFKLILDRKVGQYNLHPNCAIICAGNLVTDRAIVTAMPTAMQSRLIHMELEVTFEDWVKHVGIPYKYDNRIMAYLAQYPQKLMDFKPEHTDKTFSSPRTWEFVNRLIADKQDISHMAPLLAGTISSNVAVEFIQFTKIFDQLPSIAQILTDPLNAPFPSTVDAKWATLTVLLDKVDDTTVDAIITYSERFGMDLRVYFIRSFIQRYPELKSHKSMAKTLVALSRYINS